jgi:hypothetical protein
VAWVRDEVRQLSAFEELGLEKSAIQPAMSGAVSSLAEQPWRQVGERQELLRAVRGPPA